MHSAQIPVCGEQKQSCLPRNFEIYLPVMLFWRQGDGSSRGADSAPRGRGYNP